MTVNSWVESEEKALLEMRNKGIPVRDIAPLLFKSVQNCYNKIKSLGKGKKQSTWTDRETAKLIKMTENGFIALDVSKKIDKSRDQILYKKKNLGLSLKGEKMPRIKTKVGVATYAPATPDDYWKSSMEGCAFEDTAIIAVVAVAPKTPAPMFA